MGDGEEHSKNGQEGTPEDRRKGEAVSLREVPQAKPEVDQGARTVVLREVPLRSGRGKSAAREISRGLQRLLASKALMAADLWPRR